jgi:hypothetical protein
MENIPDIEDREFPTSQGHWLGDLQWEADPGFGIPPAITATVNDVQTEAELTLSYPHIRADREAEHELNIYISAKGAGFPSGSAYGTLTDGVYSYPLNDLTWLGGGFSYLNQFYITIPEDWDVDNTQLMIHIDYLSGDFLTLIFTHINFESTVPSVTAIQYLPITGIG